MQTGRNPFARENIRRHSHKAANHESCSWCGGHATRTVKGKTIKYLFTYEVDPDSGKPHTVKGQFCGISCCNAYHGDL